MRLCLGGVTEGDVFMCVFLVNGNDSGEREVARQQRKRGHSKE